MYGGLQIIRVRRTTYYTDFVTQTVHGGVSSGCRCTGGGVTGSLQTQEDGEESPETIH